VRHLVILHEGRGASCRKKKSAAAGVENVDDHQVLALVRLSKIGLISAG
jgi:hypothetical protein